MAGLLTTTVQPDLDERTDERTDEDRETGTPRQAHIVRTEPGESALAKVTEARIYGFPVEALCGERFVPQRDPKKPPACVGVQGDLRALPATNDGLRDTGGLT